MKRKLEEIVLKGVRQNNLKGFDLKIPTGKLTVVTGLSGSGKSSLVFDTLYAEGQRRYVETFSPYARQFMERLDKPKVDSIRGILPAIAVQQGNSIKTSRSTVGTLTELCDYFKLLMPHASKPHCPKCEIRIVKDDADSVLKFLSEETRPCHWLIQRGAGRPSQAGLQAALGRRQTDRPRRGESQPPHATNKQVDDHSGSRAGTFQGCAKNPGVGGNRVSSWQGRNVID
jgi:hypothetical protein